MSVEEVSTKNGSSSSNCWSPDGLVGRTPVPIEEEAMEQAPISRSVSTYICYMLLIFWGYIADFMRKIGFKVDGANRMIQDDMFKMSLEFERFYTRNIYRRIRDCWNRPVGGVPGAYIELIDRKSDDNCWTFYNTGTTTNCLNLGSYNYLGFAQTIGPCADAAIEAIYDYGVGSNSARRDYGTLDVVRQLENQVARFVGKPDALVFGMGFGTNSSNIPALVEKGCLLISDELNHASIAVGAKTSGATVRTYKHNDIQHLEKILKSAVVKGQPRTHKPWKKIMIIVEGVYSMEGSVPRLREIIALKKKYKAYLYLDEAHSIGAMGATGRGVTEYLGIDPADVDIMMGTFTKSFGGCGGYIAASHEIINYLRHHSHATIYGASLSAPVALQVLTSMKSIMGEDGTDEGKKRLKQLADNTRYFRDQLKERGYMVYGNKDSPVVPVIIFEPSRITVFSRMLLEKKIAVVVVGFPATPITLARARFCISASHTKEMLDYALAEIDEVDKLLVMKIK